MADRSPEVRVIAFDLDGTLAEPGSPVPARMAGLLGRLLGEVDVCVISGGGFDELRAQVAERLDVEPGRLSRLHLMPVNGTGYHRWRDGAWHQVYREDLPVGDSEKITSVLVAVAKELGLWEPRPDGDVVADRGNQITFCPPGGDASPEARRAWDTDGTKQARIRALAAERLPDQEVRSGGGSAVEVTAKGVNKAYGMRKLLEQLGLHGENVVFVGDRLEAYGNDQPVKAVGVECVAVSSWEDTADFVEAWLRLPR